MLIESSGIRTCRQQSMFNVTDVNFRVKSHKSIQNSKKLSIFNGASSVDSKAKFKRIPAMILIQCHSKYSWKALINWNLLDFICLHILTEKFCNIVTNSSLSVNMKHFLALYNPDVISRKSIDEYESTILMSIFSNMAFHTER